MNDDGGFTKEAAVAVYMAFSGAKLPQLEKGTGMSDQQKQPMDRWSDEELLRAAHAGNDGAFQAFCTRSLPSLHRFLRRLCAQRGVPRDLASDFAQTTFIKAIEHIRIFDEAAGFHRPKVSSAWLMQIGNHLVLDWLRTHRRRSRILKTISQQQTKTIDNADEQKREEIIKFFGWLKPAERDIVELVLLEGLHPLEAGQRLGISEAAAYKNYERALAHLRDLIREHGDVHVMARKK